MASITKLNGKWRVRVSWYDDQGKRHFKTKAGFPTKLEANRWARSIEVQKNDGSISNKSVAFADYFNEWFKTYKENKIVYTTAVKYRVIHRMLTEFFGNKAIDKITRRDYQNFMNNYGSSHAPESVKKTNATIRACVKSAILDDLITKDFTQNVELIWNNNRVQKVDYLNVDEINRLADYVYSMMDPRDRYTSYYMIYTAIMTGMRLQEIAGLKWDDINFNWKTININKAWDFASKRLTTTKTESSNRIIRVNSKLLNALKELKSDNYELVFENSNHHIPESAACNRTLRKALVNLNIDKPSYHFHSLRHSHVALLLYKGVDIYAISKRLGHSDLTTTTKKYAYLIDELKQKTDDNIESILDSVGEKSGTKSAKKLAF
ncbi:tyrosine-type recombinase/integrase [Ligilactobacillus salivarius]|uniref:Tyrosine-type recombinase/integrase n=1 Tax=Ligilactobacillus salivarius TaxID=1624 RepID=A0AAW7N8M1_9LACO|nr:tyrosine-type recombinase/integrase [Ligilactobacillus salivarius]MDN4834042.1 tyrosine-type recombinase/integrase [Ligilactobacillus salivarius]